MATPNPTFPDSTLKHPSAFLPIAMSLGALALTIGQIALVGIARQADESTVAHLWQLLMVAQAPIIAFFAIRYLSRRPKSTAVILTLQALAVLAACAPVYFLHW